MQTIRKEPMLPKLAVPTVVRQPGLFFAHCVRPTPVASLGHIGIPHGHLRPSAFSADSSSVVVTDEKNDCDETSNRRQSIRRRLARTERFPDRTMDRKILGKSAAALTPTRNLTEFVIYWNRRFLVKFQTGELPIELLNIEKSG